MNGLVIDGFAGGGGASTGLSRALGRSPDYAINHDPIALALHAANHPETTHVCGDIWDADPARLCAGRPVDVAWFSPDCRHFSRAKGSAPVSPKVRSLAFVVVRWARAVQPRIIFLENCEEFRTWGPLDENGRPRADRAGRTYSIWLGKLKAAGYRVESRTLRACDFGAPTSRKRFFLVARRDGHPIVWPRPTHGPGLALVRTAAECIDWTIPCPSIFDRRPKPLVEATLRRIGRGVRKFVLDAASPFVVPGDISPSLIHLSNGERRGQAPRVYDIREPLSTVVAGGTKHGLVCAFMAKAYGGHSTPGQQLTLPLSTVTAQDHHHLVEVRTGGPDRREHVRAFLTQYNGQSVGQSLRLPLNTAVTKDRFGLVMVRGEAYEIRDIGMRMLAPRELARAQGFSDDYQLAIAIGGRQLSRTRQVRLIGNSVCPDVAEALVRANASTFALQGAA